MAWDVEFADEFGQWWETLNPAEQKERRLHGVIVAGSRADTQDAPLFRR